MENCRYSFLRNVKFRETLFPVIILETYYFCEVGNGAFSSGLLLWKMFCNILRIESEVEPAF